VLTTGKGAGADPPLRYALTGARSKVPGSSIDSLVHRAASRCAAWTSHAKRNVGYPASQEGDMTTSTLTIRATITKGHDGSDGYAVSVVLKEMASDGS